MSTEVMELHNIAISIMQRSDINVVIDNRLETAMTDYKNLYVTIQLIPPELRKYRRVVSRVLDGEVAHEAGHIVVTAPVRQRIEVWINRQHDTTLANIVHQSLEDKRVNHFILQRYRFDFAHRLQLLADVSNRLWIDTLKAKIAEQRNSSTDFTMKPESYFLEKMLIPISALKGMWNWDVENEFQLSPEQKAFCNKVAQVFSDARFDKMPMTILNRHNQLYKIWQEQVAKTYEEPEDNCPKNIGGNMKLKSGAGTSKAISKIEKKLKKAEDKLKAELERENKREKEAGKEGMSIGEGSGLHIPSPEPDEQEYTSIVQRNREHIERLLNLLKKLAYPKLLTTKFQRQGRFMTEILAKAYGSSMAGRHQQYTYSNRSIRMEKAEACIGLLVDLSGSVNEYDAKNALTVISEVCGRWIRDEDFSILIFGSEYQKIKAYVEPYHTTRNRIGGIQCLGGTKMLQPLEELFKMTKAQTNGKRAKIIAIVSDFYTCDDEKVKKLIKTIEQNEIAVIGLGIDSTTEQYIKTFCNRARYIGNIRELPEAVYDLYREVAF